MPDIFYLMNRWWKQILLIIVLSVLAVAAVIFFQPTRYLAMATALPANPALTDKASIFNTNIQALSSSMGGSDELDVIVGTAQLDTVYLAIADSFNLWDHYKTEGNKEEFLFKSASVLKKNTRVIKSDFGELKVKVWDTDNNLAPQLANAIMEKLNAIHQDVQNESNKAVLAKLRAKRDDLLTTVHAEPILPDSANSPKHIQEYSSHSMSFSDQLQQYEKLILQYQLILDSKPAVLVIVERARPADKPDRPGRWMILIATAFLAFLFGLLLALVLERRKMKMP